MDSSQRIALYKNSLDEAIQKWEQVVILTDPASEKFVQFAVQAGEGLMWVDIPVQELSEEQYNWLLPHMEPMHASTGELLSLQKEIKTEFTQYAAEYTEWMFTKIFQLHASFNVTAQIFT